MKMGTSIPSGFARVSRIRFKGGGCGHYSFFNESIYLTQAIKVKTQSSLWLSSYLTRSCDLLAQNIGTNALGPRILGSWFNE